MDTADAGLQVEAGESIEVDVELITSEAAVSGRARDQNGQPATLGYVILFARDPRAWAPPSRRIFGVRPDQNGRYVFLTCPQATI